MRLLARLLTLGFAASSIAAADLPNLRVSDNKRFVVTTDGKPFFYLFRLSSILLRFKLRGLYDISESLVFMS